MGPIGREPASTRPPWWEQAQPPREAAAAAPREVRDPVKRGMLRALLAAPDRVWTQHDLAVEHGGNRHGAAEDLVRTLRVGGALEILRDEPVRLEPLPHNRVETTRQPSFKIRPEGLDYIRMLLDGAPPRTVFGAFRRGGWEGARTLWTRKRYARRRRVGERRSKNGDGLI